jgi:hypothetical protein
MVVSPPKVTSPVDVLKVPGDVEASKLPEVWVYPVMFSSTPKLVRRDTEPVYSDPSERLRLAMFAPLLFSIVSADVDPCDISSVVDPAVKGILVSAIARSLNVFAPVKVCVVERSERVMVPVGIVASVPPPPVVKVTGFDEAIPRFPSRVSVPVVQLGCEAPPEIRACPLIPTLDSSKESLSEYTIDPDDAVIALFVPPYERGSTPETSAVKDTEENVGAEVPLP